MKMRDEQFQIEGPLIERCLQGLKRILNRQETEAALTAAEKVGSIPEDLYAELGHLGLFALSVPVEFGGFGLTLRQRLKVHSLIARRSASLQSVLTVHEMVILGIHRFGRPDVKSRWLRRLATGDCLGAFTLTESGGGSSFEQIQLFASTETKGFKLDGVKSWASSGLRAGVYMVFAMSDTGPKALLVSRENPGLTVIASPRMGAFNATSMASVRFNGCMVGAENQIGSDGLGLLRVAMNCLSLGRVLVGVGALAIGAAALDATIIYARRRIVGRDALAVHQLVQKSVADSYIALRAAFALVTDAAAAFEAQHPDAIRQAMVAKLYATDAARHATADALRLHGAAGLTADSIIRRYAAESQVYSAIEGNVEALSSALGADILRAGSDISELFEEMYA